MMEFIHGKPGRIGIVPRVSEMELHKNAGLKSIIFENGLGGVRLCERILGEHSSV